jgi:hypothetical protein
MNDDTLPDARAVFALHVVEGVAEMYPATFFPDFNISIGANTSASPVIRVDLGNGEIYNVTITRARK